MQFYKVYPVYPVWAAHKNFAVLVFELRWVEVGVIERFEISLQVREIVFNGGTCGELGLNIYPQSCAVLEIPNVAPWPVEWTADSVSPGWCCPAAGTSPSWTLCAAYCGLSRSWYREGWVYQALLLLSDSLWLVYDYVPFGKDKFFHDFLAICASEI